MAVTIASLIPQLKDYIRNQNLTDARAIRALDKAVDYVNSELGLPSQEDVYEFDFDQSQAEYSLPVDFIEPIFLRYKDDTLNRNKKFSYRPAELLYDRIKSVTYGDRWSQGTQLFGVSAEEGTWKLYVLGTNSVSPLTLDTFDRNNSTNWTAGGDASNIHDDLFIYEEGAGSLGFDITVTGTSAYLYRTTFNNNLYSYVDVGHFKLDVYLQAITNFTSVSLIWGTDSSNYFLQTAITQETGTAFAVGWNNLDFEWDGSSEVGAVDPNNITYVKIIFTYAGAYAGGTSFRVDNLRVMVPDVMKLTYYTGYKGTSSTSTPIVTFTATTDILKVDSYDIGLMNLYAIKAAEIINPQILNDDTSTIRQYEKYLLAYKRKFPRKRCNNLIAIPATPNTD